MRFSVELAVLSLALSSVKGLAIPGRGIQVVSLTDAAYVAQPEKRQLSVGGLTLGGPSGGISGLGVNLPKSQGQQQAGRPSTIGQGQQPAVGQTQGLPTAGTTQPPTAEGNTPSISQGQKPSTTEGERPATTTVTLPDGSVLVGSVTPASQAGTTGSTSTQPQRPQGLAPQGQLQPTCAEGSKLQETQLAQGQSSSETLATQQAQQFTDNGGITVDRNGNPRNVGGELGITAGTDGSTSVGGEDGINVAAK